MNNKYSKYYTAGLEKKENEELENIISDLNKRVEYKNMVDLIDSSNWELEQYLVDDYDVIMDKKYLKHEGQIVNYFSSNMHDYFDCGQGYYQDEANIIAKIADKFYKVTIMAEIGSSKQDYGDRLYWVDSINNVEYIEIEKPKPKERHKEIYELELTKEQKIKLDNFLKEL